MNSEHTPAISVIVPVYKAEKYIHRCLDSIINQTFRDFELILIDDGSPDKSGEICDEYAAKDERVKVIHKENEGVSVARNCGIDKAQGKYISFVDADDEVAPTYMDTLNKYIQQSDIVFFSSIWFHEDKSKLIILMDDFCSNEYSLIEEEILLLMKNNCDHNLFGFTWNKIFKADIIKEHNIKFIENLSVSEDEIFTLDYCRFIKSMMVISTPLYNYYRKKDGLTHRKKEVSEWLSLADNLRDLSESYSNSNLKRYLSERFVEYLLIAINDIHLFNRRFYSVYNKIVRFCRKNSIPIPYKSIIKTILIKIYKGKF